MPKLHWFKGNLHTHTTESDGDADPRAVTSWYRRHEYDFLVLSDHNHRTILDYSGRRRFKRPLMIPGEEVTVRLINNLPAALHMNAIGITRVVEPIDAVEMVPTMQANIDAIVEAGGIAQFNHPNFQWAFDHESISQTRGASLLEIYNVHPGVNSEGGLNRPSVEQMWDSVLSTGLPIYGVASDDAHHYHDFTPDKANPGRGWVVVRAPKLDQEAILDGLAGGEFYSSTGVELLEVDISQEAIELEIEQVRDMVYTTTFFGRDGVVLDAQDSLTPSYRITGTEGYVRATVASSSGTRAWTQPVFLKGWSG